MRVVYLILVLIVAIIAVIFSLQNSVPVAITFFSWSASGSLSLVLILTLTIGILLGVLITAPSVFRRSVQFSGLKRQMTRLEKEKDKLHEKISANEDSKPVDSETKPDETTG
ncbi:MAG: hypothetical protein CVV51_04420 [Spirochaetae bacterium HGW-Spirochaetae-7]|jgi:uncharacterized integral membrane protein|nr:MAG: hypothetical protein CVV51_04420 [Spirochaetae bacterium HGW-Spirochaetae-7]